MERGSSVVLLTLLWRLITVLTDWLPRVTEEGDLAAAVLLNLPVWVGVHASLWKSEIAKDIWYQSDTFLWILNDFKTQIKSRPNYSPQRKCIVACTHFCVQRDLDTWSLTKVFRPVCVDYFLIAGSLQRSLLSSQFDNKHINRLTIVSLSAGVWIWSRGRVSYNYRALL